MPEISLDGRTFRTKAGDVGDFAIYVDGVRTAPGAGGEVSTASELTGHEGQVVEVMARTLLLRRDGRLRVVDAGGKTLASFPVERGRLSPDHRWLISGTQSTIEAYRLP